MNTKTTLPISEARKKIFKIAEDVQKPGVYYTLTENGSPKAVMMSAEEFDSLLEDLEILSSPQIMADIKKAEEEIKRGDYVTWTEMKKEFGYENDLQPSFASEKPKRHYGAPSKAKRSKHGKKNNAK